MVLMLRLTFYTAPMTVIMLLPFYWALESEGYSKYKSEHSAPVYLGKQLLSCRVVWVLLC
jgi:hypothetical protein